ncbi:MAG: geranylgeranylglyceryl/heptaprenylglyceryl phosphate synthase [Gemmatimonadota bacterium]|nr:MAG: geranylgeranylglyceryl/heptaprenylglyceryl phosphate synthase [Gemmatimonadota bacterium]
MSVYQYLMGVVAEKGAGYLPLLDPDRLEGTRLVRMAVHLENVGVDALLIGSSLLLSPSIDSIIKDMKQEIKIPVIIFPGSLNQVSPYADAILFLSLISGRNPDRLIGDQVKAAPAIKEYGIEPIPTGYMLIESGRLTSVQFMSNTVPIPRDKPDIAVAHALAAEYLGMKMIYLEAGSGAEQSIPVETISSVKDYVSIPLIVGGGIRTPECAAEKVKAVASLIVTGNILEKECGLERVQEFCSVIHFR